MYTVNPKTLSCCTVTLINNNKKNCSDWTLGEIKMLRSLSVDWDTETTERTTWDWSSDSHLTAEQLVETTFETFAVPVLYIYEYNIKYEYID